MALSPWTEQRIADNLLRMGYAWTSAAISFGFPGTAPSGASSESPGFSPVNAAQIAAARLACDLWDDLVDREMSEVAGGAGSDIEFCNSTTGVGYAHAYFPGTWGPGGSIWFNPSHAELTAPRTGQWSFMTYLHELGHALGLGHPGNYSGNVTYERDAAYQQDTVMYSVMSYFQAERTGADRIASDGRWYAPQTPMVHDVLAIQQLYGADTATRAGDTVYGFNATAANDLFDFTENRHPVVCIWDGGGNDTLDLSGFSSASRIDLRPGAFSNADGMTKNLSIAFGALIENAIGGGLRDYIGGNDAANVLMGRGGGDRIWGGAGADRILGGNGRDVLAGVGGDDVLAGGLGADRFVYLAAGFGGDRIVDFTDGEDALRFAGSIADAFGDFAIDGNGSRAVVVRFGAQSITLQGPAAITLTADDFEFLA